ARRAETRPGAEGPRRRGPRLLKLPDSRRSDPESFPPKVATMQRFNLSHWAVTHQALVLFFIIVLAVGGTISYLRLGRAEDPSFTIKVAVVTAMWPGATATEMQAQVADRIEKKLQELPY